MRFVERGNFCVVNSTKCLQKYSLCSYCVEKKAPKRSLIIKHYFPTFSRSSCCWLRYGSTRRLLMIISFLFVFLAAVAPDAVGSLQESKQQSSVCVSPHQIFPPIFTVAAFSFFCAQTEKKGGSLFDLMRAAQSKKGELGTCTCTL